MIKDTFDIDSLSITITRDRKSGENSKFIEHLVDNGYICHRRWNDWYMTVKGTRKFNRVMGVGNWRWENWAGGNAILKFKDADTMALFQLAFR